VGLEFAGEIRAAWPEKAVTVVDPAADLVSGRFPADFRSQLRTQLDELGVELLLGTSLRALPESDPGRTAPFTVTTWSGVDITADIWFPCYGAVVNNDYLDADLSTARQPNGQLAVTLDLRVHDQETVFAIGDITAIPEMKMARLAQKHAGVAATNIRTLIEGRGSMVTYQPEADAIALPLGPKGGVSYAPEAGVLGAGPTADLKADFYIGAYHELFGVAGAA
jgi:NADH dehydrogenase FAD-containing subunit